MFNWDAISAISSALALIAIVTGWMDLKRSQRQEKNNFEDSLSREYREIMERIPVDALLGKSIVINATNREECYSIFYRYFDLCNEQKFLADKGRISQETWHEWQDGIRSNLKKPAFRQAWDSMKDDLKRCNEFQGLAQILEAQNESRTSIPSLPAA